MRTILLILGLLMAFSTVACAPWVDREPIVQPSAPLPPPIVVVAPAKPVATKPAEIAVVKGFDSAKARELATVTSPAVTLDQIERIHIADQCAQQALRHLGHQHNDITAAALSAARSAVHALEQALDQP
jgi:hypothetical protein